MRVFQTKQVREAIAYAEAGGQALHLFKAMPGMPAPPVFRRYDQWAHLIDHDEQRLVATVKRLGVKVVKVGRLGARGQHVDLCGKPLERALAESSGEP